MPNNYLDNKDRWDRLSDMDYLSAFVNAWLAFNAWYRSAYGIERDREIIDIIKQDSNVIRDSILPLLLPRKDRDESRFRLEQEADNFKTDIGLLHRRLEEHHLYTGKKRKESRITMTNIHLRDKPIVSQVGQAYRLRFVLQPEFNPSGSLKKIDVVVKWGENKIRYQFSQIRYDEEELRSDVESKNILNREQISYLVQIYRLANPKYIINLVDNSESPIDCGAFEFKCSPDDLFSGIIETIYLMRCHLFHGEMVPSKGASACYEPAYRIIKFMLGRVQ